MRTVLIIADEFPPMGGAGVQRTSKFTKYLPQFQYTPHVFTRTADRLHIEDSSLLGDIPSHVSVTRTKARNLLSKNTLLNKALYYKLLIPDGRVLWYLSSKKQVLSLAREIRPDVLYTTSFPYSDHLMGLYLKKWIPELPWVADFRDEWTNNSYFRHGFPRKNLEKRMEKKVLDTADALIANTPLMMRHFIKAHPGTESRFTWIPNGFDLEDFAGLRSKTEKNPRFTVVHTGSVFGIRKPDMFFRAVGELLRDGVLNPKTIDIRFIGNLNEVRIRSLAAGFGADQVVSCHPYLPHKDCIQAMVLADCCLLIEGNTPESRAIFTGKVFEYLHSGTPILGIIPEDGVAAELILDTQTGLVTGTEDIAKIKQSFLSLYRSWLEETVGHVPIQEKIMEYERKNITRRLAGVFDELLRRRKS